MGGPNSESILRFENVTLRFDEEPALDGVSFDVRAGESSVVLGAAGSGKTVLLKAAIGLLEPDEGRVFLFGKEISAMEESERGELRAKVGILFQEGGLFDSLTIEENVGYPLVNHRTLAKTVDEARPRVEESLRFVELENTLEKFPSELSGGMRRRAGIARANVADPALVLYDSPTAGLDPITAFTIMAMIVKERDTRNTTTVMVTHQYRDGHVLANYRYNADTGKVEMSGSDANTKFLVMQSGKLVFEGEEHELRACDDPYVSKFTMHLESPAVG